MGTFIISRTSTEAGLAWGLFRLPRHDMVDVFKYTSHIELTGDQFSNLHSTFGTQNHASRRRRIIGALTSMTMVKIGQLL